MMIQRGHKARHTQNLARLARGSFTTFCYEGPVISLSLGHLSGAKRQVLATREDMVQELELFAATPEKTDGATALGVS